MFINAFLCGLGGMLGIIVALIPYFIFADFWKWVTNKPVAKDTMKLLEDRNKLTDITNGYLEEIIEALKTKD